MNIGKGLQSRLTFFFDHLCSAGQNLKNLVAHNVASNFKLYDLTIFEADFDRIINTYKSLCRLLSYCDCINKKVQSLDPGLFPLISTANKT